MDGHGTSSSTEVRFLHTACISASQWWRQEQTAANQTKKPCVTWPVSETELNVQKHLHFGGPMLVMKKILSFFVRASSGLPYPKLELASGYKMQTYHIHSQNYGLSQSPDFNHPWQTPGRSLLGCCSDHLRQQFSQKLQGFLQLATLRCFLQHTASGHKWQKCLTPHGGNTLKNKQVSV